MVHAHIPQSYWPDAFSEAVPIVNNLPSQPLNFNIPLTELTNQQPNYATFMAFGCSSFPLP